MSKATIRFETAVEFLEGEEKDLPQALLWLKKAFDVVESSEEVTEMAKRLAAASDVDPEFKEKFDSFVVDKMIEDGEYDKAESILLEMAEAGDAEAMYKLGDLYEEQDDDEKADKWMLLAYENGSAEAKKMAKYVFETAEKGAEEGTAHWKFCALANWLATGKMCHGWPCERNVLKAVKLYEKAFAAGSLSAAVDLATLYFDENSGVKDYDKMFEWCFKAAEKGDAAGQYLLGECFLNGYGVSEDIDKAVDWYTLAAEAGNVMSMVRLGRLMTAPDSEVKDIEQGVKWLTRAAEEGDAEAQSELGALYLDLDDSGTVARDVIAGIDWLKKSAAQAYGPSECMLGVFHFQGIGVEKNLVLAKSLFEKALEHGGLLKEMEDVAKSGVEQLKDVVAEENANA